MNKIRKKNWRALQQTVEAAAVALNPHIVIIFTTVVFVARIMKL
jgi:hypothetical protein